MSDTQRQARTDLAAALRLAAHMGLHEGSYAGAHFEALKRRLDREDA
jgi:hypothetical protein